MSVTVQEELQYEEVVDKEDAVTEDQTGIENDQSVEDEIEAIKARVREMEEEAEKLRQIQADVDKQMSLGSPPSSSVASQNMTIEAKMEADNRSIYVGSVDYGATAEELEQHFHGCGAVNRVTILCNKYDGHPKGFAYIEFTDTDSVRLAMALDDSLFRGRQLKVMPKRTNKPGISTTHRPPKEIIPRRRSRRRSSYGGYRPTRGRRAYYSPY